MEFCSSRRCVDVSAPRLRCQFPQALPFPWCQPIPVPCFYTPERGPSQEMHSVLFLPSYPVPKSALITMTWPCRAKEAKAAQDRHSGPAASHARTKEPALPGQLSTSTSLVGSHHQDSSPCSFPVLGKSNIVLVPPGGEGCPELSV